jgi:hypothetical protein
MDGWMDGSHDMPKAEVNHKESQQDMGPSVYEAVLPTTIIALTA